MMRVTRRSKYAPLKEFFSKVTDDRIELSFADIETIIGARLPPCSFTMKSWWANRQIKSCIAKTWLNANFSVVDANLITLTITFERPATEFKTHFRVKEILQWNTAMIKALRIFLNLNQQEFANRLKVRQATVSAWETGKCVPRDRLCKELTLVAKRNNFNPNIEIVEVC